MDDNVGDVLRTYTPAKPPGYYASLSVSKDTTVAQNPEPATGKQRVFLDSLGVDGSLWDGTQGSNGLRFDDKKTSDITYKPPSLSSTEVSRLRSLHAALHRAARQPAPSDQQELNGRLLLGTVSTRDSERSLVAEARDRLLVMWDGEAAKNWDDFLRPAILARVFGHDPTGALAFGPVGSEANKSRKKAVILHRGYIAARKRRLAAAVAFADAHEALHGLFGLEASLRNALEDLRKDGTSHVRALVNVVFDLLGQGFVTAVQQGIPGKKGTWEAVKRHVSSAGKAKEKKAIYEQLRKAYEALGGFYDAAKAWKISVKSELEDARDREEHTFKRLLDCWEDLLDV